MQMIWPNVLGQCILFIWALYLTYRTITRLRGRKVLVDDARSLLMVGGLWALLLATFIQMPGNLFVHER